MSSRFLSASLGLLALAAGPVLASGPTYHKDIAPILQTHCQDCHRPGQVAPFSLLTYEQARKRATDLAGVTETKRMPPWHASTDEGGPFRDARVLPVDAIKTLAAWSEAGAPEGDSKDAPAPRVFASEWPLGEPDLILKPSEVFTLSASGPDEFRVFVMPTGLSEGKWVRAIDFRPGNPKIVHHLLAAFDIAGIARKMDAKTPEPGYRSIGGYGFLPAGEMDGWAPGKTVHTLDDGVARYLPAGSDFLLQVHYHRSGKPEPDQTAVGLYFATTPVEKQLRALGIFPPRKGFSLTPDLAIPAGKSDYEVTGSMPLREDIHLRAAIPHMHWLGKDFLMWAELPDGTRKTLIKIDRWDFSWQGTYDYAVPIGLPKGTVLKMLAHFDNSSTNPANQNRPPIDVSWGEQTNDEMCIGFLHYTRDAESLKGEVPAKFQAKKAE